MEVEGPRGGAEICTCLGWTHKAGIRPEPVVPVVPLSYMNNGGVREGRGLDELWSSSSCIHPDKSIVPLAVGPGLTWTLVEER